MQSFVRTAFCAAVLTLGIWVDAQESSTANIGLSGGLVRITKSAPDLVSIGTSYKTTINISANDSVGNVVVSAVVPSGAEYVSSSPAATVADKNLT
jgi:hypothetical protein